MTTQTRQLFGTDGIRGVAGEFPLTQDSTYMIGRALGHDLKRSGAPARVVIGQDTRESSAWIADRVTHGLAASGIEVHSAGVITTPGVAYLARSRKYAAGVVISASHNPWTDNGIKVFSGDGYKLPDAHEIAIEQEIFALLQNPEAACGLVVPSQPESSRAGRAAPRLHRMAGQQRQHRFEPVASAGGLRQWRRHGRSPGVVPPVRHSGDVSQLPLRMARTSTKIAARCILKRWLEAMAAKPGQFDLGVTFDGDADRALFCDANGRVVNGDAVILMAARHMKSQGTLPGETVVATTMSNMGLEIALRNSGIRMLRANVGDKYVLEEMQKSGAVWAANNPATLFSATAKPPPAMVC